MFLFVLSVLILALVVSMVVVERFEDLPGYDRNEDDLFAIMNDKV